MRHRTGRLLVAGLIGTGSVAWGLAGGLAGIAHAAAGGQQCEPLTPASSSPSATAANLCVSVQASQSGIKRGQAASFTVQTSRWERKTVPTTSAPSGMTISKNNRDPTSTTQSTLLP